MSDAEKGKGLLEGAYRLATPADSVGYYRDQAAGYDADFIEALGYVYPQAVARAYAAAAGPADLPVADIGCGTGAVAAALGLPRDRVDGFDISPEMLAVAAGKDLYARLFPCDLTRTPEGLPAGYGAVVSAGTFTQGHLGPAPLRHLLALARPGALFVIGVNAAWYAAQGFGPALAGLAQAGLIEPLERREVPIYDREGHPHAGDTALVLTWRKR